MRMWRIPTQHLCAQHLLGAHNETHMIAGAVTMGKNLGDFLTWGLIDTGRVQAEHIALGNELVARGYNHNDKEKPLVYVDEDQVRQGRISRFFSYYTLARIKKCAGCICKMSDFTHEPTEISIKDVRMGLEYIRLKHGDDEEDRALEIVGPYIAKKFQSIDHSVVCFG